MVHRNNAMRIELSSDDSDFITSTVQTVTITSTVQTVTKNIKIKSLFEL